VFDVGISVRVTLDLFPWFGPEETR